MNDICNENMKAPNNEIKMHNPSISLSEPLTLTKTPQIIENIDEYCNDFVVNLMFGSLLFLISLINILVVMIVAIRNTIAPGNHSKNESSISPSFLLSIVCSMKKPLHLSLE